MVTNGHVLGGDNLMHYSLPHVIDAPHGVVVSPSDGGASLEMEDWEVD